MSANHIEFLAHDRIAGYRREAASRRPADERPTKPRSRLSVVRMPALRAAAQLRLIFARAPGRLTRRQGA